MTVRDRDRGARRMQLALERLAEGVTVTVGIHRDDGRTIVNEDSGLTLAGLAAIHEFGAPADGIPARAWLRAAVDGASREIERGLADAATDVARGRPQSAAFKRVGDAVVRDKIRARMSSLEPLKPATVERKGHADVLRDTGHFQRAIDARVTTGGAR